MPMQTSQALAEVSHSKATTPKPSEVSTQDLAPQDSCKSKDMRTAHFPCALLHACAEASPIKEHYNATPVMIVACPAATSRLASDSTSLSVLLRSVRCTPSKRTPPSIRLKLGRDSGGSTRTSTCRLHVQRHVEHSMIRHGYQSA